MSDLSAFWPAKIFTKQKDKGIEETESRKFGTFVGAFIPCILMVFGVVIFLRLGWIVGLVGPVAALTIITLAALIALITTLSMASISTNIEMGKGGVYYMLSRSLGIEVGSAIGIPLYLKQALSIAFCVIGFAESVNDLAPHWPIPLIGIWTLAALAVLAFFSINGAMKVQVGIFIAILAALISLFTGSEVVPMHSKTFIPGTLPSLGFWAVFALFFPAMTGVESSVSLSGDLRNPSKSLPLGTISAILVAYLIYVGIALFLVYRVPMNRLVEDPLIMQDVASVPALIVVGIWGATLSSALGGLLGAPRTLQALADDGIAPSIFSKTFGVMKEPRNATLVTCLIALFATYFGSVNLIAPLLTMICLICYTVLNLSAGLETLMANPSWRPRFRVHGSISIAGAVLCLIAMLLISVGWALSSFFLIGLIYFVMKKRQFKSGWADIRQGILQFYARMVIYQLADGESISKSWRPHFLVFSKTSEKHSSSLMKFSEAVSQSKSFLTLASFVSPGDYSYEKRKELGELIAKQFKKKNINAFVQIKEALKITSGMNQMIEHYGLGPLAPNTIVMGASQKEEEFSHFADVLQTAFSRMYNVIILNDSFEIKALERGNKEIHVWWDDENQSNSELMIVLSYMLLRNPSWKKMRLTVKATVQSELHRQEKMEQFKSLSLAKRLPLDVDVYVSSEASESRYELMKEFSKGSEMTFMSLKDPPKKSEAFEEYAKYLKNVSNLIDQHQTLAFVLSSEKTPLETVLM